MIMHKYLTIKISFVCILTCKVRVGKLLSWEVGGVAIGDHLDDLPIDEDGIITSRLHISIKDAEDGVVFEEVGGLLDTSGVVDGDNIKGRILSTVPASEEVPADPSKSIDGHLDRGLQHSLLIATPCGHLRQYKREIQISDVTIVPLVEHERMND